MIHTVSGEVMTLKQKIINCAEDTVANFLYYDRKEDEDLPIGSIEAAINVGEVTVEDIVEVFKKALRSLT